MKKTLIAVACAASLSVPANAAGVEDLFTSFYSFGDSLSDDGKFGLAGQGGLLEPPSDGGRFSTGQVWSEYIEDAFLATGDDTRNYALGGATASPTNPRNPTGPLGTLQSQIDAFTFELFSPLASSPLNPGDNPLVSLWFGANDIFTAQSATAAADFVAAGVRAIGALGAAAGTSFDNFLIFDLPTIPGAPGQGEAFNARMDDNVAALRREGFDIIRFDPQITSDAIIADALVGSPEYGITIFDRPCTASFTDGDPSSCLDNGEDPNTYFFADSVHPTAPVHLLTSQQVSAEIIASVPLPASLPLVLTALGGTALLARRRRKAA